MYLYTSCVWSRLGPLDIFGAAHFTFVNSSHFVFSNARTDCIIFVMYKNFLKKLIITCLFNWAAIDDDQNEKIGVLILVIKSILFLNISKHFLLTCSVPWLITRELRACARASGRYDVENGTRSLARLVDSWKLLFDFRLLSAFDSFRQVIHKRNGDLCC